ncbi:IPT/TIG domain containing protein [Acanthamoeba castellanii str. Neff]|uniref:IPT/TIG domain containing protein n=1 Tax=Acanthamoeba castellanii (strain ATCC 30010 / Neff) TaxID=1257118 RepID=L8GSG4_ACACF|nr:IPT/TIG domain containing protein [Acanthamoeba castellanii str. Neff]ELR15892.1 IPT/TIG domain containing protein [Acanthamoeba castellanii str. Neff]
MNHQTINQQLHGLLVKLHQLGQDHPQVLIYLTQIAQPKLPQNLIIPFLGQMFEKLPPFLSKIEPPKLQQLIKDPPADAVPLRILIDLLGIQQLLQQITVLQLLHLTNNTIPPGSQESQEAFLKKVQEVFQSWSFDTMKRYHSILSETPLHLERQQLLQLEPGLPWEILHLLIELLKLPVDELFSLQNWLSKLSPQQTRVLIQLLQIESSTLLEIKRRIASATHALSSSAAGLTTSTSAKTTTAPTPSYVPPPSGPTTPLPSTPGSSSIPSTPSTSSAVKRGRKRPADDELQAIQDELDLIGDGHGYAMDVAAPTSPLSMSSIGMDTGPTTTATGESDARQPPSKTVYQRILKPFPTVMLLSGQDNDSNLFVEATLLRSDNETPLPQCVDGNRIVRITNGVFAAFKKLKILSTSQQQGTLFRLRFTLKKYAGAQAAFEDIPGCTVISNPIEVFSHTQYLNEKQESPPPPVVMEVLPSAGPVHGGTRIVILGSNFINSSNLKVRFGDMVVPATFHEAGTLICVTPSRGRGVALVSVTNDGVNFCETQTQFTFE